MSRKKNLLSKKFTIRLTEREYALLDKISRKKGVPLSDILRERIRLFLAEKVS